MDGQGSPDEEAFTALRAQYVGSVKSLRLWVRRGVLKFVRWTVICGVGLWLLAIVPFQLFGPGAVSEDLRWDLPAEHNIGFRWWWPFNDCEQHRQIGFTAGGQLMVCHQYFKGDLGWRPADCARWEDAPPSVVAAAPKNVNCGK